MMENTKEVSEITILDGGMGRELERIGAPFRQPEWSALALMDAPHLVARAHHNFIAAGAEIITTNSYAVVPFHLGWDRFNERGEQLAARAAAIARQCATAVARNIKVAGCLPPALGSYRPDLFCATQAIAIYEVLIHAQEPDIDIWLAETLSSIAEARIIADCLTPSKKPLWIAYTLEDRHHGGYSLLRSGEQVGAAVTAALDLGAAAVLFNCSQPEVMAAAVREAVRVIGEQDRFIPVGVYANSLPPQKSDATANIDLEILRDDLGPEAYAHWATIWYDLGASIIGGCCGVGPPHIRRLVEVLRRPPNS